MNGKWSARNERTVFESDFIEVTVADVTLSDGTTEEHNFVSSGEGGAAVIVHDPDKGILMIWRHRLIGNSWGWEIPGGRIEDGEKPAAAAARELLEETGWQVDKVDTLFDFQPCNGFLDHPFHYFYTNKATWVGPHPDPNEVADLAWIPVEKIPELIAKGDISSGFTLTPILYCLAVGPLAHTH